MDAQALTEQVRSFFEGYAKAFDSLNSERIAACYHEPCITLRGDGSIHCFQSRQQVEASLKGVAETYYRDGNRSSIFKNLSVLPIGGRSLPARRYFTASCLVFLATVAVPLAGCGSAQVSGERQVGAASTGRPSIVYVTDFELDASNVHAQRGILPPPPPPPPGLGNVLPRLPGTPVEPAVRARQLVDLMSTSLVRDLANKGVTVRRIKQGEQPPANGWLVRGVFTEVQEGNQFRRAVIGFGVGHTELQVLVAVDDLTRGAPQPMYEVDTKADSGKLPGAAITLNPYVAAARFVLSGSDLDRNVKQTAAQITEQLTRRLKESGAAR